MRPDGTFVFCMAAGDPRSHQAIHDAGLHLHVRQDVLFRAGRPPTIALFVARKFPPVSQTEQREPFVIWGCAEGVFTPEYFAFQKKMGLVTGRDTRPTETSLDP